MNLLKRFNVGAKLTLAFGAVLLALAFLGGFSILQLSQVFDQSELVATTRLAGVRDSLTMANVANRYRTREFRLMSSTPDQIDMAMGRIQSAAEQYAKASESFQTRINSDKERALFAEATRAWAAYTELSPQIVSAMRTGDQETARALVMVEGVKRFDVAMAAFTALSKYNDDNAAADVARSREIFDHGRTLILLVVLAAIAAATLMAYAITQAIARPLRSAVALARNVAAGDLTQTAHAEGNDEPAQLTRALGDMVSKLRSVVSEVRSGIDSVSTASAQIATGNHDLSARTEQTASNLQETASAMDQLTGTVTQAAETALQANQLANTAAITAQRGGQVVEQVVESMSQISGSSKKIADIIGVIDGIAFQTNILALNAAVEAARAGEQGRGFAVVAGEVRNLAQRSAQAAKEIKSLIQSSVESVDGGARLVEEAGRSMQEIVQSVRRMTDMMGEINSAASEQRDGIGQVNHAVNNLDQMTQQNAALVEESAAAAASLRDQAGRLGQIVSMFNVGDHSFTASHSLPAAAPAPTAIAQRPAAIRPAAVTTPSAPRASAPKPAAVAAGDDDWTNF